MLNYRILAGAEAAVFFGGVPAVYAVSLYANALGIIGRTDEFISVSIGNYLDETPHIACYVVLSGVGLLYTVPIYFLCADLLHESCRGVKLVLGKRLHGNFYGCACKHACGFAFAAWPIQYFYSDGNGFGFTAGQRTIGQHARCVVYIGGTDNVLVAAGDLYRRIFAVKALAIKLHT